jgi:hypothetical protein
MVPLFMQSVTVKIPMPDNSDVPLQPDRWEVGFRNIVTILIGSRTEFDIADIVEKVRHMKAVLDEVPYCSEHGLEDTTKFS